MKLQEFKRQLDIFINEWCTTTPEGRIKMQSHDYDIELEFFDKEGNELSDPQLVFQQFMGCGCVCGLAIEFTNEEENL